MSNIKNTKKHFALEKTKKYKDNTYMDSCNIHYQAVWNTYKYSKKKIFQVRHYFTQTVIQFFSVLFQQKLGGALLPLLFYKVGGSGAFL